MSVFLYIFDDDLKTTLLGVGIFDTFSELIKRTNGFFSYNDIKKLPKKKNIFQIVIINK